MVKLRIEAGVSSQLDAAVANVKTLLAEVGETCRRIGDDFRQMIEQ